MIDQKSEIVVAFEKYKTIIFNVDVDLNFWTGFVSTSIVNFQQRTDIGDEIYEAGFAVYDWDIPMAAGYLKMNPLTRMIRKSELDQQRLNFFAWIRNLAVLKSYNALELLLIDALWIIYFPAEKAPSSSKKAADNIQNKIKEQLSLFGLPIDSKNNRHLIEFLKHKVPDYSRYLNSPLNIDLTTTWGNYFEMISVLRNIIAHQGTIINTDTLNEIKSKAKDIFQRHFKVVKDDFNDNHLQPKEIAFSHFVSIINTFALNTIKFASGEVDFGFLNMQ
ncbi:hypothetical protein [Mucilaginibacter psychrotolerans]|uniref:Uncharacterized protein n=1 Tax=Mucilaginibacter psychrotolerans TaxID=1524096 RepID=A0A4Y8SEA6_9SPHI|nr:hypothetical protein [Mucilaginibacter psychrotolerans]TFF37228.1 hypothetical protein E2R66_12370 [Mucilaginibacter psychrotolerans]